MNINKFWAIVERCKDCEFPEAKLEKILSELPTEEIAEFFHIFQWLESYAHSETMWCAAYLLNDGCSDDGFEYFCRGLIAKGRAVYELALKDPDDLVCLWGTGDIDNELFGGPAARYAYINKTGSSVEAAFDYLYGYKPDEVFELYIDGQLFDVKDRRDEHWSFANEKDNRKRLPRLSALYYQSLDARFAQLAAKIGFDA